MLFNLPYLLLVRGLVLITLGLVQRQLIENRSPHLNLIHFLIPTVQPAVFKEGTNATTMTEMKRTRPSKQHRKYVKRCSLSMCQKDQNRKRVNTCQYVSNQTEMVGP